MNIELTHLPDDVARLKEIIHFQAASHAQIYHSHSELEGNNGTLQQRYSDLERSHTGLIEKYNLLEEQLRLLKASIYGRKSEKYSEADGLQTYLFNETEETFEVSPESEKTEEITVASHKRVKGGRRPLPEALPRVEVIHDLSEDEKACGCGTRLSRFGEEVSEKLDIIPAKMQVIRHIRYKYACKSCEGVESEGGAVRVAPLLPS